MMMAFATLFIFSVVFLKCQCSKAAVSSDVYWRDYTGVVPGDAVPGGYDLNNQVTYIGQAFVKDNGVIPGVIYSGVKQMTVPIYGTKIVDTYVKILCSSNPVAFQWLTANTKNLHSITNTNAVVKGGEENGYALYIGRAAYQGEVITGKIITGIPGAAPLYFAHKNKEIKMESYQLSSPDIYWREYKGVIPDDAFPGGYDGENRSTYIGQGYVKDRGIIPGVIYSGIEQMMVPMFGTQVINSHLKILCSFNPDVFKWLPAKSDNFHLVTINKYVVRRGEETDHVVYIGRTGHEGEVITGKIVSGPFEAPGRAPMYFVHKNQERVVHSYEALVLDSS